MKKYTKIYTKIYKCIYEGGCPVSPGVDQGCQILLVHDTQNRNKMCQMNTKYTKWS
jgi:hypothetical protein